MGFEIGDDDPVSRLLVGDMFVGAARALARSPGGRMPAPSNQALAQALAARQVASGVVLKPEDPTKARKRAVGIPSTSIATGVTTTITVTPQQLFKPQRIVLDPSVASLFLLTTCLIGNQNQLLNATAIPGSMFLPSMVDGVIDFDTVQPNQPITLAFQNQSLSTAILSGAILGRSAET